MTAGWSRAAPAVRVRFTPRDLLAAGDVMDDAAAEARLRQLHVRALHRTWGIALGLHAASSDAGDHLLVGPGLGFDACQRELVLDHPVLLAAPVLPAGATGPEGWFDLVARDDGGVIAWRWAFAGSRANPGDEPPLLADDVRLGVELPIARVLLNPTHRIGRVDPTLRCGTRKPGPRVISGTVPKGAPLDGGGTARQWACTIDLSAGHFTLPPMVFVALELHPLALTALYAPHMSGILGPFIELKAATKTAIQARVTFALSTTGWNWPGTALRELPVALRWIAVERPERAEPAIVLSEARTLEGASDSGLATKFTRLVQFPPPGGVIP